MAGPGRMRGDGRKAANPGKTLLRLLSYMKKYIPLLVFVFLCIIATSVAQAQGSRALGPLVDDYILPMVAERLHGFRPAESLSCEARPAFSASVFSAPFSSTI